MMVTNNNNEYALGLVFNVLPYAASYMLHLQCEDSRNFLLYARSCEGKSYIF